MTYQASLSGGSVDGVGHVDFGSLYADKPAPPPVNLMAQQQAAEHAQRGRELRAVLNDQDATDDAKVYALVMMRRMSIPWPDDHRVDDAEDKVAAYEADVAAKIAVPAPMATKPCYLASPHVQREWARLALQARIAKMLLIASRDPDETEFTREAAREMFSNQSVEAQQIAQGNR